MIPLLLGLCLAQEPAADGPAELVMGIVAARDLYPGVTIAEGDIYGVQMPESELHPDAFRTAEDVLGKVPWQRILANELVLPQRLEPARPTLPVRVPAGHRALVVRTPAPSKPLKRVELWRLSDTERCQLAVAIKVADRDPLSVIVPPEVLPAVLDADADGTLRAVSPASQRGGPCPD